MGIQDALIVDRSSVPPQLVCAICTSVVLSPAETPCHHLFCKECLLSSFAAGLNCCPMDRNSYSLGQIRLIKEVNPILYQIWADIRVRCPNSISGDCLWVGSPADLSTHAISCPRQQTVAREELVLAEKHVEDLQSQVQTLQTTIRQLTEDLNRTGSTIAGLRRELNQRAVVLDQNFAYHRGNIVELTKVILFHLYDPPSSTQVSRVFNCILHIFTDLDKRWTDNPPNMEALCEMLLTTAVASEWFTPRQHARFEELRRTHFEQSDGSYY